MPEAFDAESWGTVPDELRPLSADEKKQISEIVECGRLPKRASGKIDLHKTERLMRRTPDSAARVAILKRMFEAGQSAERRR